MRLPRSSVRSTRGSSQSRARSPRARYLEDRWLPHAATRVRPANERYSSLLRRHVEPRIGRIQLANPRPIHIQSTLDGMLADGLSPHHRPPCVPRALLGSAPGLRWQLLATNPASAVSPPRPDRPGLDVPDPSKVRQLIDAAEGPVRMAVLLAARQGCVEVRSSALAGPLSRDRRSESRRAISERAAHCSSFRRRRTVPAARSRYPR